MSEMVDRVANAIRAKSREIYMRVNMRWDDPEETQPINAEEAAEIARAAIEAMREPTKKMVEAGTYRHAVYEEGWQAMIDAALKE